MYLMKYGYMDDMDHHSHKSANLMSRDGLKKYIMEFQAFAGMNVTGELDADTVKMMNMPRCGVKDKLGMKMDVNSHQLQHHHGRSKRFALQGAIFFRVLQRFLIRITRHTWIFLKNSAANSVAI